MTTPIESVFVVNGILRKNIEKKKYAKMNEKRDDVNHFDSFEYMTLLSYRSGAVHCFIFPYSPNMFTHFVHLLLLLFLLLLLLILLQLLLLLLPSLSFFLILFVARQIILTQNIISSTFRLNH